MNAQLEQVRDRIVGLYNELPPDSTLRLIIGVAGIPGSGKSTVAYPLTHLVNAALSPGHDQGARKVRGGPARCVGLDGWHYSRAELDRFPNPQEAHYRRGAAFTYDSHNFAAFVDALDVSPDQPIEFPTFAHEQKDPVPSSEPILPGERIIIIEGMYVLLDEGEWSKVSRRLDLSVWVDTPRDIARKRCIERNFKAGLVSTLEETIERVDKSDMVNGDYALAHSIVPGLRLVIADNTDLVVPDVGATV